MSEIMESVPVRVIVYDGEHPSGGALRELLDGIGGLRVVEQLSDVRGVGPSAEKFSADLVIANLDPKPDDILAAVAALGHGPARPALFATSRKNDANLILSAVRAGFGEFVRLPDESSRLVEAINALRRKTAGSASKGQIVSVVGSAGGVGCTTIAVNLAVELADKTGSEVALVDLDFMFGHVAMMLDLDIQHSIADLCGENKTLDDRVLQKAMSKHKSNVHVIPRPREFEDTENLTAESCGHLLAVLRGMYPFVVLDGPARADQTGRCVLDMATWNLLIVQPLVTAARNAKRVLAALERYHFNPEHVQVVCNRAGGGLSHLNIQRLEKSLGHKIIACVPDDWTSVSAAINLGEPLAVNAPKSKAREAIRELADIIIGGKGRVEGDKGAGLLGRLFGRGKVGGPEVSADKQAV